ncbi:MAG: efflux transporter outer membrane subunit [Clostridia bacterium]|nr:efflux transporter outer membrane subunit [Clostridia bacterium]
MNRLMMGIILAGVAGCTLTPPAPLTAPVPPPSAMTHALTPVEAPFPHDWWTRFGDSELTRLIELARTNNVDLAQAAARMDAARARARIAGADAAVQVTGSASALRQRTSENTALQIGSDHTAQFGADLNFSYELDIWGRVKAARTAAEKEIALATFERNAAEISLLAQVARNYLTLRALQQEIAVIRTQIARYTETEKLQSVRVDSGFATELDLQRTRIERASAEGECEQLRQTERGYSIALTLLCGLAAEVPVTGIFVDAGLKTPDVPQHLSLAVLEARPDVVARRVAWEAAAERLHVAQAERLPTLRLSGAIGYASQNPEDLLNWKSHLWSITAGLTAPLYDGGRLRGNQELMQAQLREATSAYSAAMLTAYREVADARSTLLALAEQQHAATRVRDAAQRALALAHERYEKGFATYLEVIESERSLLAAQRTLVRLEGGRNCATVDLVRALGWW